MSVFSSIWKAIIAETELPGPYQAVEFPSWLLPQYAQSLSNLINLTNDHSLGTKLGLTEHDINEYLANVWIQSMNKTPNDPLNEDAYFVDCPPGWDCTFSVPNYGGTHTTYQLTYMQWNTFVTAAYQTCLMRIDGLWPGHADEIWPYFYYRYDTPFGQILVDDLIERENPPQPLIDALRSNYTEDSQKRYGFLNEPDMFTCFNFFVQSALWWNLHYFVNPIDAFETMKNDVVMLPIDKTAAYNRLGNPFWTVKERKEAYDLLMSKIPRDDTVMQGYWQFYISVGWFNPGGPNKPPTPVQDPSYGAGKKNPQVWPDYLGNLPYAPEPKLKHQKIGTGDTDPNAKQVCVPHKGPLEKIIPTVGGVIGAGLGLVFMPGRWSKVSAAVTLGGFGFYYFANAYGWDAFLNVWYNGTTSSMTAAIFLSVGAPVTGVALLYDLELVPQNLDPGELWMVIAAGALGYATLEPILGKLLPATNTVSVILTAPLAWLERVVGAFTDGCVEAIEAGGCLCQDANMKSKLAESIVGEVYGATEDQLRLRVACVRNQMLQGDWGTDPEQIGYCDPSNNNQSNIMSCRGAEEWTDFNVLPADKLMTGMYDLIRPCLDPTTPNFMPPRDVDVACAGYGPHYRLINGKCIDYGIDHPDPSLKSQSNESCTIL